MNWIAVITAVTQLIMLILKNKFEGDAQEKLRKDKLHALLQDAINRRDANAVNDIMAGLRK